MTNFTDCRDYDNTADYEDISRANANARDEEETPETVEPKEYIVANYAQYSAALTEADVPDKVIRIKNIIEASTGVTVAAGKVLLTSLSDIPMTVINTAVAASSTLLTLPAGVDFTLNNVSLHFNKKFGIAVAVDPGAFFVMEKNSDVQSVGNDSSNGTESCAVRLKAGTEDNPASLIMRSNSSIKNCNRYYNGGQAAVNLRGCGVAAYAYSHINMSDDAVIERCAITMIANSNQPQSHYALGAGIYAVSAIIDITDNAAVKDCSLISSTLFSANYAGNNHYTQGANIYISAASSLTISGHAVVSGGIVSIDNDPRVNPAAEFAAGGGIYSTGSSTIILRDNVSIESNIVQAQLNRLVTGGGIFIDSGGLYILGNVKLRYNVARVTETFDASDEYGLGGAICQKGGGEIGIYGNVEFASNTAGLGGAIYFDTLLNVRDNVLFAGNTANKNGGAIYSAKQVGESIDIARGVIFTNNSAEAGGRLITGTDKTKADSAVLTHNATEPYKDVYNNHDIVYTGGSAATILQLTFNSYGGTNLENSVFFSGETPARPEDPTRTNSIFRGWYTDASFSQPFDFDVPRTSSGVAYARWTCLPGYRPDGTSCVKSNCTPLQHYDPDLDECVPNNCQNNQIWDDTDGCLDTECPEGYVYVPEIGICRCPEGMIADDDGTCGYRILIDPGNGDDPYYVYVTPDIFLRRPPDPPAPEHGFFKGWYYELANGKISAAPFDFSKPVTGSVNLVAIFACDIGYGDVRKNPRNPLCQEGADSSIGGDGSGSGGKSGINGKIQGSLEKVIDSIGALETGNASMMEAGTLVIKRFTEDSSITSEQMADIIKVVNDLTEHVTNMESVTKEKLCCMLEKLCECGVISDDEDEAEAESLTSDA